MEVHRQEVVDLLQERGDMVRADQASANLPEHFETDDHLDKLEELGVDAQDLTPNEDGPDLPLAPDGVIRPVSPIV